MKPAYSPFLSTQSRKLIPKKISENQLATEISSNISSLASLEEGPSSTSQLFKNKSIINSLQKQYNGIFTQSTNTLFIKQHLLRHNSGIAFKSQVPRFLLQNNNTSEQIFTKHNLGSKYSENSFQKSKGFSQSQRIGRKFQRIYTQKDHENERKLIKNREQQNEGNRISEKRIPISFMSQNNEGGDPFKIREKARIKIYEKNQKMECRLNSQFFKKFRQRDALKLSIDFMKKDLQKQPKIIQSKRSKLGQNQNLNLTVSNSYKNATKQIKIRREGWLQKNCHFSLSLQKERTPPRRATSENKIYEKLRVKFDKIQSCLNVSSTKGVNKENSKQASPKNYICFKRNSPEKSQKIKRIIEKNKEYKRLGPGQYQIQKINKSNKNGRDLAMRYQFFGSSSLRFEDGKFKEKQKKSKQAACKKYLEYFDEQIRKFNQKKVSKSKSQNIKKQISLKKFHKFKTVDKIRETFSANLQDINLPKKDEAFIPYSHQTKQL